MKVALLKRFCLCSRPTATHCCLCSGPCKWSVPLTLAVVLADTPCTITTDDSATVSKAQESNAAQTSKSQRIFYQSVWGRYLKTLHLHMFGQNKTRFFVH